MAVLRNIGNSMGILIPKSLIKQAGLEDHELTFELKEDGLLIKPISKNRSNWASEIEAIVQKHGHDIDDEWLDSNLVDSDD